MILLIAPQIASANTLGLPTDANSNVLTGEQGSRVVNSYTDKVANSIVLLYDDGTVVIYNHTSGNLIGVNNANDKIIIMQRDGKLILQSGKK